MEESAGPSDAGPAAEPPAAQAPAAAPAAAPVDEEALRVALEAKERGNAHFKSKQWAAAIECYTHAIELVPTALEVRLRAHRARVANTRVAIAH